MMAHDGNISSGAISLFCLMSCLVCVQSCQYSPEMDRSLRESGSNRLELEKVLAHYQNQRDSESLKAAEFLIANMYGHHSCESPSLGIFYGAMDSLYPDMSNVVRRVIHQIPMHLGGQDYQKVYDVEVLDSEFLIAHIDRMMEVWRTCRWLSEIAFEEFCEYLLPYRFAEGPVCQDLDSTDCWWRDIRDEVYKWPDLPLTPTDVRLFLRHRINNADDHYKNALRLPGGGSYTFDCEDEAHYEISTLRASGVPATLDFVPDWTTRNGRHYWSVIVDPYCLNANSSNAYNLRVGKVYRRTYSHQPIPLVNASGREVVPVLFQSPFLKDVTAQYARVSKVTVPIKRHGCRNVYLAVFNEMQWKPIAWSRCHGLFVRFSDVGSNGVYLPVVTRNDGMCAVGPPFILHADGRRETLRPSDKQTVTMSLSRKYPLTYSKMCWAAELQEYVLEAAEDSSFATLGFSCPLTAVSPYLNECEMTLPDSVGSYRYWRVKGRRIHMGEMKFLDDSRQIVKGRIFVPDAARKEISDTFLNAIDGDALTYTTTPGWIGIDFGSPQKVSAIRYVSRSDANGIKVGNTYELYVFDWKWRLLERRQAVSDTLLFEGVPSGGLYWLHCLDEGREERIFTYEQGRQVWW